MDNVYVVYRTFFSKRGIAWLKSPSVSDLTSNSNNAFRFNLSMAQRKRDEARRAESDKDAAWDYGLHPDELGG